MKGEAVYLYIIIHLVRDLVLINAVYVQGPPTATLSSSITQSLSLTPFRAPLYSSSSPSGNKYGMSLSGVGHKPRLDLSFTEVRGGEGRGAAERQARGVGFFICKGFSPSRGKGV